VFGGSFNPPHHCHVMAVGLALSSGEVDRVSVIPADVHPFDKPLAPFEDRREMCLRAFAVFGSSVEVSDLEARIPGPGYTIDILRALAVERPGVGLRLILGADLLDEVDRWKAFDEVVHLAPPLWIGREGRDAAGDVIFPFSLPDVSSSEIRRRLALGDAPTGLVPAGVLEYINDRGLYGFDDPTERLRVLILGLGRVGTVLARWLAVSGAAVRGWDPVAPGEDRIRVMDEVGVEVAPPDGLSAAGEGGHPDLVVVAAPDAAIGEAAQIMDEAGIPTRVPAVHCSGSAPCRALARGARPVGRMHPVFPFATPDQPLTDLAGLHLILEGDADAVEAAAAATRNAGGRPVPVDHLAAPRYHAACVMAANHLAALGMAAEELAEEAGVPRREASAVLRSLMAAALRNAARLGFRGGLTGPAARGEAAAIRSHLESLADAAAETQALYRAANSLLDIRLGKRQSPPPTEV